MVRQDQLVQILRPQLEGPLLLGVRGGVGRGLLFVAGAEGSQNPADQGGGLAADISVRHHQQLVEEVQGLFLLPGAPVGEILLKNGHIGPEAGGLLLAAGGLQNVAEQLLPAQPVHQADVVVHGGAPERGHHLVRRHQCRVLPGRRCVAGGGQGGVHAEGDHVLLKVPQLGVDILVAAALGVVHVVQLAENHIEGILEGVQAGALMVLVVVGLLHSEVGVHQDQGL